MFSPLTSASSAPSATQGPVAQSAFQQLGRALQSGDLSGAQEAYSVIQQNASGQAPAEKGTRTTQANPIADLKEALRKDNLSAAQQKISPDPSAQNAGRASGAYPTTPSPGSSQVGQLLNARV